MQAGPTSKAPPGGRFTEALMRGVAGFQPDASSGCVSVAPEGSSGGTFSEGLARTVAGTERPDVAPGTQSRVGEIGGTPVYYNERLAREAITELKLPPWREEKFASRRTTSTTSGGLLRQRTRPRRPASPPTTCPVWGSNSRTRRVDLRPASASAGDLVS